MKTSWLYLRFMLVLCLLSVGFASCSDDDEENTPSVITFNAPKEVVALADATSVQLTFTAPAEWNANASSGWFSLNKTTGMKGENTLVVNIDQNKDVADREGSITLTMGTADPITITVKQYGKNAEFVFMKDEVELTIDNENHTIAGSVNLLCNYEFDLNLDADWVTCTREADEEAGNNRYTVNFTVDAARLKSYEAAEATLTATYQAATRALPADKSIKVKFPGITPTLKFYTKDGEGKVKNLDDNVHAILEQNDQEEYRLMVYVESNFKWALDEASIPDWMKAEVMKGESEDFFTTTDQIKITFSSEDGKPASDDDLKAVLAFKQDGVGKAAMKNKLYVDFKKLSNYVQIDFESLQQYWSSETSNIMFPATGEELIEEATSWSPDIYGYAAEFTVTTNVENIAFIATKVSNNFEPMATEVDYVTVKEVTSPSTRALGKRKFKLIVRNRGIDEYPGWTTDPYSNRYFALFAVNADELEEAQWGDLPYSTDPDQLFSHKGIWGSGNADILKEQYQKSYVTMGQWAQKKVVTFELLGVSFDWTSNVIEAADWQGSWLEAPAKGGTATITFGINVNSMSDMYILLYYNVEGDVNSDEWKGVQQTDNEAGDKMGLIMDTSNSTLEEQICTLPFKIPANTTGEKRKGYYGLVWSENGKDLLLHKFTVTQAAE